ncbi:MAG: ABC transporter permease subunit [Chloroflexi bacterium]|nr:ABC transporter permease subunit [Chloroflexota bacterium]
MTGISAIGPALGFWRNVRVRRFAIQTAFLGLVAAFGYYLFDQARDLELGFDFLDGRAGFDISHQFGTSYGPNDRRLDLYLAGIVNTIRLAGVGIILATLLGLVAGVARLSGNWLVSRLALVYVETVRNTPLLVQIIFWYIAVFLQLPRISDSINLPPDTISVLPFIEIPFISFDFAFLSVRGLALPWATTEDGFGLWLILLFIAAAAAVAVRFWRAQRQERTGQPSHPTWWLLGTFALIAFLGFAIAGFPLDLDRPEVGERSYDGGIRVTAEFAALLVALVTYTGAFIAEIVRGSLQAVPKGQTEASAAVGLNPFQRLSLVTLPQALRIMIPPITSQYLNLTKNSSLAVAIAFPELVGVSRTIINNTGQTIPMFLIVMATYLLMSLIISLVMNTIHSRFTLETR